MLEGGWGGAFLTTGFNWGLTMLLLLLGEGGAGTGRLCATFRRACGESPVACLGVLATTGDGRGATLAPALAAGFAAITCGGGLASYTTRDQQNS